MPILSCRLGTPCWRKTTQNVPKCDESIRCKLDILQRQFSTTTELSLQSNSTSSQPQNWLSQRQSALFDTIGMSSNITSFCRHVDKHLTTETSVSTTTVGSEVQQKFAQAENFGCVSDRLACTCTTPDWPGWHHVYEDYQQCRRRYLA